MRHFGEILSSQRRFKRISISRAASDLLIKKEHLEALEQEDWPSLPEPPFVKGFITSYAHYLGLDPKHILAVYRREYDERKYPKSHSLERRQRRLFLTPARLINLVFVLAVIIFITYLTIQYLSILESPKVEIFSPQDDITLTVPAVVVSGRVEKDTIVSINGEFVPIDENGNFSYQYNLKEGKNTIEIIASKRLSPKSRIIRTIRLVR